MLKAMQATLRASAAVSPKLSARIALKIATMPMKARRPEREKIALQSARQGYYTGASGKQNPYWQWGSGPVVILSHGWGGRGSQLAILAQEIAISGYTAVIYDASAHGDSHGRFSGFRLMMQDVLALSQQFDSVYAYVCHSMGGMSVMSARRFGLTAEKFVILASPYAPLPIVEILRTQLKVSAKALEICKNYFASEFDTSWGNLIDGEIYHHIEQPALLIYDRSDRELPPDAMLHCQQVQAQCQQAETLITDNLGHKKILAEPRVMEQVVAFLAARR